MENGQTYDAEEQVNRTSNMIRDQYVNPAATGSAEQYGYNKAKKQKNRKWPVSAKILTVVLTLLLIASGVLAYLNSTRIEKLENVVAKDHPELQINNQNSSTTAETGNNSSETANTSSGITHSGNTQAQASDVSTTINNAMETVVSIDIMQDTRYGMVTAGSGSGVVFSEDGKIVTCYHVIDGADKIYVFLNDGMSYEAELISGDSVSDLAVLKIDASGLAFAKFADSDTISIGENVFAIGNMLGELSNSCTRGCISGINRNVTVDGNQMTLLQTDAAINHGNSGGGLFRESDGTLIGIVNAKSGGSDVDDLGFAIPSNDAGKVVSDLLEHGFVTGRPYLGVATKDVRLLGYGIASYFYVYPKIVSIDENSPAEQAGLRVGDIILEIDETTIDGTNSLSSVLYSYKIGDTIKITVYRGNEELEFNITLAERMENNN